MIKEHLRELGFLGSLSVYLSILAVFFIFEQRFALVLLGGLVACYVITSGIRLVFFRERPDKTKYSNWLEKIDAASLPSLHSMRSIFLALMIGTFFQMTSVYVLMICLALLSFGCIGGICYRNTSLLSRFTFLNREKDRL